MNWKKIVLNTYLIAVLLILSGWTFPALIENFGGYKILLVVGRSMVPTMEIGDLVVIQKDVKMEETKIGEMVAFRGESTIFTHRVTKVIPERDLFITKGDANKENDQAKVKYSQLVGRVVQIIPTRFLATPIGTFAVFTLPLVLLSGKGGYIVYQGITTRPRRRRNLQPEICDSTLILLLVIAILIALIAKSLIPTITPTGTYYSDRERAGEFLETGEW